MMNTMMKVVEEKPTVQSTEEEATQPLGPGPPSVYLFVLLLIGCHLLQNPICLGQLHLSSGIFISEGSHWTWSLPDPGVQWLSSFLPSSWCPFPCSCFQYLSLCFCLGAPLHSLFTWANCPGSVIYFLPHALNLMIPKLPGKGLHLLCFSTPQW